jgi:anti-sigma factor RsiW
MARNTTLSEDLAALAEEQRSRLGEPPTAEQLIAYRDGQLPEEEAERIRDRLAVDPEWAAVYLDLKRFPDLDRPSDADVDAAWRTLSPRLERTATGAGKVIAFRRRPVRPAAGRALLALAATLILCLGLTWLLVGRGGPRPLPSGEYHAVEVTGATFRDARLAVPRAAVGLAFHIDATALEVPGKVLVELRDASGEVVRQEGVVIEAGQREIVFRVASSSLEVGRTYQLAVRASGTSPDEPALIEMVFTPVFED